MSCVWCKRISAMVTLSLLLWLWLTPAPSQLVVAHAFAQSTRSTIQVEIRVCDTSGRNANCMFDRSLDDYSIGFEVYPGFSPVATSEDVITVRLDLAAGGMGRD